MSVAFELGLWDLGEDGVVGSGGSRDGLQEPVGSLVILLGFREGGGGSLGYRNRKHLNIGSQLCNVLLKLNPNLLLVKIYSGLGQFDFIYQIITLSVIALSDFNCNLNNALFCYATMKKVDKFILQKKICFAKTHLVYFKTLNCCNFYFKYHIFSPFSRFYVRKFNFWDKFLSNYTILMIM